MDELVHALVRLVRFRLGYHHINLFINDPAQEQTQLRASSELKESMANKLPITLRYDQGLVGWVAGHGETVMANDVSQDARFMFTPLFPETRAEIAVPLTLGARCIGVLDVQSNIVNAFDKSDVVTLETLASQVAIALENARLYGEVQEQARHDSLTQAYNHGFFLRRLTEEIDRAQQTRHPLTLIMLDIDLFKEYNDRYGHVAGDKILELIVHAIRMHIKHTDMVGRWGGEEFSIILLDTDESDALRVSERIRKTMRETKLSVGDAQEIPAPTISQGIALFPADANDMATLVDRADTALYRAKARGRDQVCLSRQVHKK
jgi:diguanylate cyclase (GGDEF)-like protein